MKTMNKVKWEKDYDFMDESPRYTFEGRDPALTYAPIRVVIYTERERKYSFDSSSVKNYYYGYIRHEPSETADTIGRFETLKEAKEKTLELFYEYCEDYPNDIAH